MAIASRTFLSLQDEVLQHQFSPQQYRSLVKTWLVEAVQEIARSTELRTTQEVATFSLKAAEETAELPADFARTIDLRIEAQGSTLPSVLTKITIQELDALEGSTGRPVLYAVFDDDLILYPSPDASYSLSLRYWSLPDDMEADADPVPLPRLYQKLPISYAMKMAYARENDYVASGFWNTEWEKGLAKMKGEVVQETEDGPTQVQGAWEGSSTYPRIVYP